jgi:DNA-binding IclR family transcriptional regulator
LPEERVVEIIEYHGLPQQSPKTITDPDDLLAELATIREQGYALDDEERTEGLRCIGAPVHNADNEVLGAISVSAPISRMQNERIEEELPERVLSAVNLIELNMTYA